MPQILTNKNNLPDTLVKAIKLDTHRTAGDVSVTQLIDGPQIRILKKHNTYEVDVSDNLYMLMGTALHGILERANVDSESERAFIATAEILMQKAQEYASQANNDPATLGKAEQLKNAANWLFSLIPIFFPQLEKRYIFEKTMRLQVGDMTLYGTFDLFDKQTGILWDYKLCSVYSYIFPESRKKWFLQTNVYAYMIQQELGLEVKGIRICAIFRDWSEHGLTRNSEYPSRPVMEIDVPLGTNPNMHWTDQTFYYIKERVNIHSAADNGDVAECTGSDRWAKATEYAIMTPKSKKAIKKSESLPFLTDFLTENKHKYVNPFIQTRPGSSQRCDRFCAVNTVCPQYKREQEAKSKAAEE